jgi:hypothetical protein
MPSDDGQQGPKHVKAKLLLTPIKLDTFDVLLFLIYVCRCVTVQDVSYRITTFYLHHMIGIKLSVLETIHTIRFFCTVDYTRYHITSTIDLKGF